MLRMRLFVSCWVALGLASSVMAQELPEIAQSAEATKPLEAGQPAPEVALQQTDGEAVELASLYEQQPVVLVFFRGGWCPICTRHTQALIKSYPRIQELGAELVGISPDSPATSKENVIGNSIPFPILSDAKLEAARRFGLAFSVDQQTLKRYKGFGIDLKEASGQDHQSLPVPAVYIVDKSGEIVFAHSNPDYRQRLDVEKIVAEVRGLK